MSNWLHGTKCNEVQAPFIQNLSSMEGKLRVGEPLAINPVAKKAGEEFRTRGQLMIEVDSIEGLTCSSRRIIDVQGPRSSGLVENTSKPEIEPPDTTVLDKRSREAEHTRAQSTLVTEAHSTAHTNTSTEPSQLAPPSLFPGKTVLGFGELIANRRGDMTEDT